MPDILLFTGGLDSFIGYHYLHGEALPVYFKLGHVYQDRELETMARLSEVRGIKLLDFLQLGAYEDEHAHIPNRNALLVLSAIAAIQDVNTVYLCSVRGEASRDKSKRFFAMLSALASQMAGRKIVVRSPFGAMTKTDIVAWYLATFPDDGERLSLTRSCYRAGVVPCGRCTACFRRWVAMSSNGITEDYEQAPSSWPGEQRGYALSSLQKVDYRELVNIFVNNLTAFRAILRHRKGA